MSGRPVRRPLRLSARHTQAACIGRIRDPDGRIGIAPPQDCRPSEPAGRATPDPYRGIGTSYCGRHALHRAASPTLCRGEEPPRPARCKRGTPTRLRSTTFTFRTARWIRVGGRRVGRAGPGWAHVVGGPHPRAGSSVGIIMLEEPAAGWSRMSRQGDPSERVPPTIAGLVDTRGRCTRLESRDLLAGGPVGTGP
jgi:hypothetical protein